MKTKEATCYLSQKFSNAKVRILVIWVLCFPSLGVATEKNPLSVYEVQPVADGIIIGTTGLASLWPALNGYHLVRIPNSVNIDQVNSLDRNVIGNNSAFARDMSDVSLVVSVVAPAALDYLDMGWSNEYAEDMTVYLEVLTINTALTSLFKYTVQRPRPLVYSGQDPSLASSHSGYESFYSGHTSTAFAALSAASMTLGLRYHTKIWPWIVTLVIGTSVAAERVAAGQHFYTDVGVGAIMGTAVGVLVPWLHKREPNQKQNFSLIPVREGGALTWSMRF